MPGHQLLRRLEQLLLAGALLYGVGHLVWLLSSTNRRFVHPDFYDHLLQESVLNRLNITWSDALQIRSPGEFRPRFLAYGIEAVDQKIRLFLYNVVLVPPTFLPVAWILQLIVGAACLFLTIKHMTGDREAALAIHVTSVGFLSGFSMSLLQGKALSHVVFIVAACIMSRLTSRAAPSELLYQIQSPVKYALLLVLLAGLFLDETAIFTFPLIAILFVEQSLPPQPRQHGRQILLNTVFISVPTGVFLWFVIFVVPDITQK